MQAPLGSQASLKESQGIHHHYPLLAEQLSPPVWTNEPNTLSIAPVTDHWYDRWPWCCLLAPLENASNVWAEKTGDRKLQPLLSFRDSKLYLKDTQHDASKPTATGQPSPASREALASARLRTPASHEKVGPSFGKSLWYTLSHIMYIYIYVPSLLALRMYIWYYYYYIYIEPFNLSRNAKIHQNPFPIRKPQVEVGSPFCRSWGK